jgi:hypothetical protein
VRGLGKRVQGSEFSIKGSGFRKKRKKTAIIVNPLHLSPEARTLVF